jgi:hypothetical protein
LSLLEYQVIAHCTAEQNFFPGTFGPALNFSLSSSNGLSRSFVEAKFKSIDCPLYSQAERLPWPVGPALDLFSEKSLVAKMDLPTARIWERRLDS